MRNHRRLGFNSWVGKISLEEEMSAHSTILAWKIPSQRSQVGYSPSGLIELDMTEYACMHAHTHTHTHTHYYLAGCVSWIPKLTLSDF